VLHDLGFRGAGTAVAVLDTGVDADHPAFGSRVVAEACFSLGEDWKDSSSGDCPDGTAEQVGSGAGAPLPSDVAGWWHGTHVAGIAAGQAVDAELLAGEHDLHDGVAPEADILAVQVFHANGGGSMAWDSDIIAGLDWVAAQEEHDVAAVNLSLGAGSTPARASPPRTRRP
jgi:subtilisin family serine protease